MPPRSQTRMRMVSRSITCDELDVGPLGKERVVLGPAPIPATSDRLGVGDEEDAVRVAHADGAGAAGERQVVEVHGAGERHLVPAQLRARPC